MNGLFKLFLRGRRALRGVSTFLPLLFWRRARSGGLLLDQDDFVPGLVELHIVHEGPNQEQAATADLADVFGNRRIG